MVSSHSSDVDIRSSESDEDDDFLDDPLAILGTKTKPTESLNKLTNKRPNLFEVDRSTGLKKLKPPEKTQLPPSYKKNYVEILNKSLELQQLHKQDNEKAVGALKQAEEFQEFLNSKLSKGARSNTKFVDYLTKHKDEANQYDWNFLSVPNYVKPIENSVREITIIPDRKQLYKGDFYNELDVRVISRLDLHSENIGFEDFMKNIGASTDALKLHEINIDHLTFIPYHTLQSVDILVAKVSKVFQEYLKNTDYTPDKFHQLIKFLALFICDRYVYTNLDHKNSTLLNQTITLTLQWGYNTLKEEVLKQTIQIWSVFKIPRIFYRLVEVLDITHNEIIRQLKLQLAISILNPHFNQKYFENFHDLERSLIIQIAQTLKELLSNDDFSDNDTDYDTLKLKFQVIILCLNSHGSVFDESEKPILKNIKIFIENLQGKIPVSYQNAKQSNFRAILLLVASILKRYDHLFKTLNDSI